LQVILYKLSSEAVESVYDTSSKMLKKWIYVGYVRAHTHDVRALTVAVPISREGVYSIFYPVLYFSWHFSMYLCNVYCKYLCMIFVALDSAF
jgi:hypothetical protein